MSLTIKEKWESGEAYERFKNLDLKKKISAASKVMWKNNESREKIINYLVGKKLSAEHRKAIANGG